MQAWKATTPESLRNRSPGSEWSGASEDEFTHAMAMKQPIRMAPKEALTSMIAGMLIPLRGKNKWSR